MSVDKFKFVSPGVFVDEIDESGIPKLPERMGPLVVGRFQKGPGGRPVKVDSYKEFVRIFGEPAPGNASGDIWRSGEMTAPTYAAYAVKAWLRNNSPCTVYRALGNQSSNAASGIPAQAGWQAGATLGGFDTTDIGGVGGAYGLFVVPNPDSYFPAVQASAASACDTDSLSDLDEFQLLVSTAAGGSNTTIRVIFKEALNDAVAGIIHVLKGADDAASATALIAAINGTADQTLARYGNAAAGDSTDGVAGISAAAVDGSTTAVTLTATTAGTAGNDITITNVQGTIAIGADFTGGEAAGGAGAVTGTLAAVWYAEEGAIILTGTARAGGQREGLGVEIQSNSGLQFTAKVLNGQASVVKTATFNFNRDSDLFIRKVFNTDPTKTNSTIVPNAADVKTHWLGETFESNLFKGENSKLAITGSVSEDTGNFLGWIAPLDGNTDSNIVWGDHKNASQQPRAAQTGWFISQDNRGGSPAGFNPKSHTHKLFKFHALDSGEYANRNYKISIVDIKVPADNFNKYGSFTVQVRKASDTDNNPVVLEQFSGCNLNPTSANFIGRKVGDRYYTYDEENKRIIEHGDNDNRSTILRVEISDMVRDGGGEGLNPYGVYGPAVPITHEVKASPAQALRTNGTVVMAISGANGAAGAMAFSAMSAGHPAAGTLFSSTNLTSSIEWPTTRLRASSSEGNLVLPKRAYFGYQASIKGTRRFDHTNLDLLRGQPTAIDPTSDSAADMQYSWIFTLDDVRRSTEDSTHSVWVSGSRAAGDVYGLGSWTARSGSTHVLTGSGAGFDKFTSPMFGGLDGYDITEQDPLANKIMSDSSTEMNNSVYYTLKKAIDITSDKDFLEFDVATIPGCTNTSLSSQLVTACEDRGDALALIDIPGGYKPPHERATTETSADALGSVETAVTTLKDMNLNSSYGCAFYPWVKIRDNVANSMLYVPPSVVALGTFSSAQRKSAVWFAPAGFTRGGLSEGSAGLPVVGVRKRLTSAERDRLYDANINPIASFPAEGIVIFGQKTLQVTPSALDRINVRRLLIYLKKEISRIASRILFDQNVQQTWDRFKGQVVPFLEGVQAGLGLTDFKVLLDDTTTTPDLVDRNILYAKIFLKPARAIEFIALDFIITRSGASFDD